MEFVCCKSHVQRASKLCSNISAQPNTERPCACSFAAAKAKKGSFYAFHGSAFYNWHSILRSTIKNMSNTHMMSAGAAYGAGIYLAPVSSTSFGYSRGTQGWVNSRFGQLPTCIALREVAPLSLI